MMDRVAANLEHYMTLLSLRQKLVASNIANVDTPGYKTLDLDFQSELQSAVAATRPRVGEAPGLTVKSDGNNVSIDREARLLAENGLRFSIASALARSELHTIKSAIQEGKA